jgi:RNA polymerase sigma factor (sigma-70 family)
MNSISQTIHPDQRFLQGLVNNDAAVIREIYQRFSGKIKAYILQNNGNEEDAADILQETLIDLFRQAKSGGLLLTCPFEAFILLIAKRKWINESKKRGIRRVTNLPDEASVIGEDERLLAEQMEEKERNRKLYLSMFARLGEKCREIISRSLSGKPQEEIAASLGLSYGYLRKKKSECMATLIQYIRSNQSNS